MLSQFQKLIAFDSVADDEIPYTIATVLTFIYPLIFLLVDNHLLSGHILQYFCVLALCLWQFVDKRLLSGVLLFLTILYHLSSWQFADNHQWLYLYWVLAVFLSEVSRKRLELPVFHARSLLLIVFTVATCWKILDGQYSNGTFFQFEFIGDKRLQGFVDQFLAMDFNHVRVNAFISNTTLVEGLTPVFYKNPLVLSERAIFVAKVLSYFTVIIEGIIALLLGMKLLKPATDSKLMEWILIGFMAFTYSLIPVHGFAAILIILAIAQTRKPMVKYYLGVLMLQLFTFTEWPTW